MHRSLLLSWLAIGVVTWSSALLRAQFQEPTKEELQMTEDPKAPGAKAVYLNFEDVQDDASASRIYYERIKVLTEKGKELATVRYSHTPNTKFEVEGRTIHKDGTIVPLTDQPSDLVEFKTKGLQLNSLVVTLPSVEVGSILEYRIKFKYGQYAPYPTWNIQQDIFVHKAHFSYKTGWQPTYMQRLGNGLKVVEKHSNNSTYTLDAGDIAALPDEDWMPPLNAFKWRVEFFHSSFRTTKEFWDFAATNWAEFVKDFTKPTNTLKQAAAGMVAPGDSETVKAQKI